MIKNDEDYQDAQRNLLELIELRNDLLFYTPLDGHSKTGNIDQDIAHQQELINQYETLLSEKQSESTIKAT